MGGAGTRRMRISELARRAGVSRETIHYYLRQGLLPRPQRAGRNMAYYDEGHLSRIGLIKRLQQERFLPLSVIKRLLSGKHLHGSAQDLELLGEIVALTVGEERPAADGRVSPSALKKKSGLSDEELEALARDGVLGAGGRYSVEDLRMAELIAAARREGQFSSELTVRLFALYKEHLEGLARAEAQLYSREILGSERPLERVEGIRRSREVMNRFLLVERARLVQSEIERYLADIERAVRADDEPLLYPASPSLRARGADDGLTSRAGGDDVDALIVRLRKAEAGDPMARALLGAALLRKARRRGEGDEGQSTLGLVREGLDLLHADGPEEDAPAVRLVRGRVYVALPQFFQLFERGIEELRSVAEAAASDATGAWLAANACYFLGVALDGAGRPDEARAALERAAALDGDGTLAARAAARLAAVSTRGR